jgi:hypothetical protein
MLGEVDGRGKGKGKDKGEGEGKGLGKVRVRVRGSVVGHDLCWQRTVWRTRESNLHHRESSQDIRL